MMACVDCDIIRDCGGCDESFCIFCEFERTCATCNFSLCLSCDIHDVDVTRVFTCDGVRLYLTHSTFLSLARCLFLLTFCPIALFLPTLQCKGTYCTRCGEMEYCAGCDSPTCRRCRTMYCDSCDQAYCSDCTTFDRCDLCGSTQCNFCDENFEPMAYCGQCEKTICMGCKDVSICSKCEKSVCNKCLVLPLEGGSSPDRHHHPLECSRCFELYCGDCRVVSECVLCFKMACADCEEMKRCEKCNKVNMLSSPPHNSHTPL